MRAGPAVRRSAARAPALLLLAAGIALLPACREVAGALGTSPAEARSRSDDLLLALADRFGPVALSPEFAALRPRLLRASLVPSRIHADASAWTGARGATRELVFAGSAREGRYLLEIRAGAPGPTSPGDYRGYLELEALREGEYEWRIREELAVGHLTGADLARAAAALLRAAERAAPGDARPLVRTALPRTGAALGRLASLDALDLARGTDGVTRLGVRASLHPEWIAASLPGYASFLKRQRSLVVAVAAEDASGARFWGAALRENRLELDLSIRDGCLVRSAGEPRRAAGGLHVRAEATTKAGLFRAGFVDLVGEVRLLDEPRLGFEAAFRREPDWKLPFLVEPLLRGSLRRPFEGAGSVLSYSLVEAPGGPSLLVRRYRMPVRESWIVRWFGGLMGGVVADFRRMAEDEAGRFGRDALLALRDDVRALAGD